MSSHHVPISAPETDLIPIKCALISVSDKTGVVDLATRLVQMGIEILSTGGTYKSLRDAGLPVREVSEVSGFPEILDGRVKTLTPHIHGGLLARRDLTDHMQAIQDHGIKAIDLLVVNLYPFTDTVKKGGDFATCVENIDIGGPAMIRSAAKNHGFVTVLTSVDDYDGVLAELEAHGGQTRLSYRKVKALNAFAHTARYDTAIQNWFESQLEGQLQPEINPQTDALPETLILTATLHQSLRYGENPHQNGGFYHTHPTRQGIATAVQLQGKELSYNNLNDADAAFELVAEFDYPAVAIIKHANPCGVAVADNLAEAYGQALACDPVSAFGGVIALNQTVDAATAEAITKIFSEVIIAPDYTEGAKQIFAAKKNLRVLATGGMPQKSNTPELTLRTVAGGLLVQGRDTGKILESDLKLVTKRAPTPSELQDMIFAFRAVKHVKSNAIVLAKDTATIGIGAGQMARVDSARIALWKATESAVAAGKVGADYIAGAAAASDAFFPFADGILSLAEAGITAIIQPGGSMRDAEVIAAADDHNIAMVFTGMRHFRH